MQLNYLLLSLILSEFPSLPHSTQTTSTPPSLSKRYFLAWGIGIFAPSPCCIIHEVSRIALLACHTDQAPLFFSAHCKRKLGYFIICSSKSRFTRWSEQLLVLLNCRGTGFTLPREIMWNYENPRILLAIFKAFDCI